MTHATTIDLSLFVRHGEEDRAAAFYAAAFGARRVGVHRIEGELACVDMRIGHFAFSVVGANPNREKEPWRGGPFFPKDPGAVSIVLRLNTADPEAALARVVAAGAAIRNPLERDEAGRRCAAVIDPFGYIWGLVERGAEEEPKAA